MMTDNTISRENLDIIFNALKVGIALKCDDMLFDDFGISAKSIETACLIMHPLEGGFEFNSLGVGRVKDLYSRMRLLMDDDSLSATWEEGKGGSVGKIHFKTKKTRMEFRCKNPEFIKTNKKLKDPIFFTFNLNQDAIRFMTAGSTAMRNTSVTFRLTDSGEVAIRLVDDAGDILDHSITSTVKISEDAETDEFTFSYAMPKMAPILNAHRESTKVNISKRGMMNLVSDGFNIYLVPDY